MQLACKDTVLAWLVCLGILLAGVQVIDQVGLAWFLIWHDSCRGTLCQCGSRGGVGVLRVGENFGYVHASIREFPI